MTVFPPVPATGQSAPTTVSVPTPTPTPTPAAAAAVASPQQAVATPSITIDDGMKQTIADAYYNGKSPKELSVGEVISGALRMAAVAKDLRCDVNTLTADGLKDQKAHKEISLDGPPALVAKGGAAEIETTTWHSPKTQKEYASLELQIELTTSDGQKIIIPQTYYTNLALPTPGPSGNPTLEEKQFNKHLKALVLSIQNQVTGIARQNKAGEYSVLTRKVDSFGRKSIILEAVYEPGGAPLYGRVVAWTPAMLRSMHGFTKRSIKTIEGLGEKVFKAEMKKIHFRCKPLEEKRNELRAYRDAAWKNGWLVRKKKDVSRGSSLYRQSVHQRDEWAVARDKAQAANDEHGTLLTKAALADAERALQDAERVVTSAKEDLDGVKAMRPPATAIDPATLDETPAVRTTLLQELQIATDLTAQLSAVQARSEGGKPTIVGLADTQKTIAKGVDAVNELDAFREHREKASEKLATLKPRVEAILTPLDRTIPIGTVDDIDAAKATTQNPYHQKALEELKQLTQASEAAAGEIAKHTAAIKAIPSLAHDLSTPDKVDAQLKQLQAGGVGKNAEALKLKLEEKAETEAQIKELQDKIHAPHPVDSFADIEKLLSDPLIADTQIGGKPFKEQLKAMRTAYDDKDKQEPPALHAKIDQAKRAMQPILKRAPSQMEQLTKSLGTIYVLAAKLKKEILEHPDNPANTELVQRYNEFVEMLTISGYESLDETFEQLDRIQETLGIPQVAAAQGVQEVPVLQIADLPKLSKPPIPKKPLPPPPAKPPVPQPAPVPAAPPTVWKSATPTPTTHTPTTPTPDPK